MLWEYIMILWPGLPYDPCNEHSAARLSQSAEGFVVISHPKLDPYQNDPVYVRVDPYQNDPMYVRVDPYQNDPVYVPSCNKYLALNGISSWITAETLVSKLS